MAKKISQLFIDNPITTFNNTELFEVVDQSGDSGAAELASLLTHIVGGRREKLTADRTYYVRTDGSDSNDGLTDTSGGAFLTLQKAIDAAYGEIDLGPYNVTIQLADGTYERFDILAPHHGSGVITLNGNSTTHTNTVITRSTGNAPIRVLNNASLRISNLSLTRTGSSALAIDLQNGGSVVVVPGSQISFTNFTGNACIQAIGGSFFDARGSSTLNFIGSFLRVINVTTNSVALFNSSTTFAFGTASFSTTLFGAGSNAVISWSAGSCTFTGTPTGKRFEVQSGGMILCVTAAASMPGTTAGTTKSTGRFGQDATPLIYDNGTITSGTFTPTFDRGDWHKAVNGGAHTLAPPTMMGVMLLYYENDASAGAITTSGFTVVKGAFTTTLGNRFKCEITNDGTTSILNIVNLF